MFKTSKQPVLYLSILVAKQWSKKCDFQSLWFVPIRDSVSVEHLNHSATKVGRPIQGCMSVLPIMYAFYLEIS